MIENILFDWSGVISDSTNALHTTINSMFKEWNVPEISIEELKNKWKQPYMKFYNSYLPDLTQEEEENMFCKHSGHYQMDLIKDMPELVLRLKDENKKMFIVSSDPPRSIYKLTEKHNITKCFEEINCEVHDKNEIVESIIKNKRMNLETIVIIGDTGHEIEVGKNAKIKTIGVTWGMYSKERMQAENPDYLVERVSDLEKILLY